MGLVSTAQHGSVSVITLDNPPVNGLGAAVRKGVAESIQQGLSDPSTSAFVLAGTGRMFSGGADIREFGTPAMSASPNLREVIEIVETSPKPVIAALHGVTLGGGLELALGCHYRLAAAGAKVGLPEVTLGIIPGAGGTQRLPRLIGVGPALDMIVTGRLVGASEAMQLGAVDAVVDGDLVEAATEFALHVAQGKESPQRTSALDEKIRAAKADPDLFDRFREGMARRAKGLEAPYACVDAVEGAVLLPFKEGLAREREIFLRLLESDQSRSLRHIFFAGRQVSKIPDVPADTPTRPIDRAAVVGCGTMGAGIAMNFANSGIPVRVVETSQDALDRGIAAIRGNYESSVAKGRLTQEAMDRRCALIEPTLDYADLGDVDIAIEAVFEEMAIKHAVFRALDAACKPGAILATNTSTLDVNEIAAVTQRPELVIGTHFFSPANVMTLMENVRGDRTSKETIATVMKLSKHLGKVGVLVGVCDGFVGNRMLHPYFREADFLLEEGALPQQIDRVLQEFGFAMGPFAVADLAGLDIGWRIRQRQAAGRAAHLRYSLIADRICELGRFGQKTGAGWYRYHSGSRTPVPDPDIETLILSASDELGIVRRKIGDEEILQRCLYPLVNEGARILDEGIAMRAGDIDIVWVLGYGFPKQRGGPMFWADQVGLSSVYETMRKFSEVHGDVMTPAPLLARLAAEGSTFGKA